MKILEQFWFPQKKHVKEAPKQGASANPIPPYDFYTVTKDTLTWSGLTQMMIDLRDRVVAIEKKLDK